MVMMCTHKLWFESSLFIFAASLSRSFLSSFHSFVRYFILFILLSAFECRNTVSDVRVCECACANMVESSQKLWQHMRTSEHGKLSLKYIVTYRRMAIEDIVHTCIAIALNRRMGGIHALTVCVCMHAVAKNVSTSLLTAGIPRTSFCWKLKFIFSLLGLADVGCVWVFFSSFRWWFSGFHFHFVRIRPSTAMSTLLLLLLTVFNVRLFLWQLFAEISTIWWRKFDRVVVVACSRSYFSIHIR